jgi:TrmH family RNA methyltransferase
MTRAISSLQNQRVKAAVRLRQRRGRQQQRRILIDGARELLRAIGAGVELTEVFLCGRYAQRNESEHLMRQLSDTGCPVLQVTAEVFRKIAYGSRTEGLVAVARTPRRSLADFRVAADSVLGVLDGVEKPGNLGAVIRSADAAGLGGLIVADGGTDLDNPNVIRASLGTVFSLPVCGSPAEEVVDWLVQHHVRIYAACVGASLAYTTADFRGRVAIVLGSEATGLSEPWLSADITPIGLPMRGVGDSLNVSAAAAVLFYEALRQRTA